MNYVKEIKGNSERGHVQAQDHGVICPIDAPECEGVKNKSTDKEKNRQVLFMPSDKASQLTIPKPHQHSAHRAIIGAKLYKNERNCISMAIYSACLPYGIGLPTI